MCGAFSSDDALLSERPGKPDFLPSLSKIPHLNRTYHHIAHQAFATWDHQKHLLLLFFKVLGDALLADDWPLVLDFSQRPMIG